MTVIRDDAVVLARLDFSETSEILVLFTRLHGKVRAIAKGINRGTKSRFAAGIDRLDVGQIAVSSRQERSANLATVTEWRQARSLSGLREALPRIRAAEYVAEITGHLVEDWDPHIELFDALLTGLIDLSEASEPLAPVVAYQLELLRSIGSLPRFDVCMRCGRGRDLTHLSSHEGGMICRHCEPGQIEKWAVSPTTLDTVGYLANRSLQAARTSAQAEACGSLGGAFGMLNYHVAHLIGREPRLASSVLPAARRRVVE